MLQTPAPLSTSVSVVQCHSLSIFPYSQQVGRHQTCHIHLLSFYIFPAVLDASDIAECHCQIENCDGVVTLHPGEGECFVNGELVTQPTRLAQGGLVQFGSTIVVRFNHPQEALRLREERRVSWCFSDHHSNTLYCARTVSIY